MASKNKRWYDYLWIVSPVYLALGFVNILFAWIGLVFFFAPLLFAIFGGNKQYCNIYCDRAQFFQLLGGRLGMSCRKNIPAFLRSKWFRYGFLIFFMVMFFNMLFYTYKVFAGLSDLRQMVTLFWSFSIPWGGTGIPSGVPSWAVQFAYGFYSVMATSSILGLLTMVLYKPRSWCAYCPMGTMTQLICKIKNRDLSS